MDTKREFIQKDIKEEYKMYKTFPNQGQLMKRTHPKSFFMSGRSELKPLCFLFGERPTIKSNDITVEVEVLQLCLSRDHVMAEVVRKSDCCEGKPNPIKEESEDSINKQGAIMKHSHPKSFFMSGRTEFKPMHFLFDEKPTVMQFGETYHVVVLQTCMSRDYSLAEVVKVSDYYEEEPNFTMENEDDEHSAESMDDTCNCPMKSKGFIDDLYEKFFGN